jgi:hypothetical protein
MLAADITQWSQITTYIGSAEKLKQSLDINSDENRLFV